MRLARLARPLRTLVLLVAVVSLAIAAAPVAWHFMGESSILPDEPVAAPVAPPAPPPEVAMEPILALAPFGRAVAPEAPEAPIVETALDFELRGVLASEQPSESTAYIGAEGETRGYRIGDEVAGRATLLEVTPTQVVLEVDGVRQTLSFPDALGAAISATEVAEAPPAEVTDADRLRELIGGQTGAGFEPPPPWETPEVAQPETTQDYIDLWRDRIRANPAEVLDTIGLIPSANGYTIGDDPDSGVGLAGLQPGDVVTTVNGQAVGNVESDRQLFDEVALSGLARIEVLRDGRTLTMSFPLR